MPKITIVVTCYNREQFISEAVESCLTQTYDSVETIVVDDGSSDGSISEIEKFGSRVRLIRKPNGGVSSARNEGVRRATGDFLRFLDSDDRLERNAVSDQLRATLYLPQNSIAVCRAGYIDSCGSSINYDGHNYEYRAVMTELSRQELLSGSSSSCLQLFPRAAFNGRYVFNETLNISEDTDMILRLALSGYRFFLFPHVCIQIREHSNNLTDHLTAHHYEQVRRMYRGILDYAAVCDTGPLTRLERIMLSRRIWSLGRSAARQKLKVEADALFALARREGGRDAENASRIVKGMYRIMPPYQVEAAIDRVKQLTTLVHSRAVSPHAGS